MPKDAPHNKDTIFTADQIGQFGHLGVLLRGVHARLVAEGYIVKNGQIYKPK